MIHAQSRIYFKMVTEVIPASGITGFIFLHIFLRGFIFPTVFFKLIELHKILCKKYTLVFNELTLHKNIDSQAREGLLE